MSEPAPPIPDPRSAPARAPARRARTRHHLPLALLIAALLGCGPTPPRDINLLIVSIDTLRADRLGAYGNDEWDVSPSPHIDALADDGVLFETCYAPRGQTHPSVASMLTGLYPATHGLRENGFPLDARHVTLFERLAEAGYRTGAFIANFEVDHPVEGWVARGAEVSADGFAGRRAEETGPGGSLESRHQRLWDDRVEQAALSFLEELDTEEPFALWVHFYDVHKPYNPPPAQLGLYGGAPGLPPVLRAPGPDSGVALEQHLAQITLGDRDVPEAELARIRGLYDATVTATDQRLGRILAALEERGEADSTCVVVTSDHGEELFDHNRYFFHGSSIYDGVVKIPLVVAGPDIAAGRRVGANVRNIDILPTVLELLGLPPVAEAEGRSLVPLLGDDTPADPSPPPHAVIEWQDLVYAVSDGRHKLIWNPEHVWTRKMPFAAKPPPAGFRIDCIEGYDLRDDPLEQSNLLADVDLATLNLATGEGLPSPFDDLFVALTRWIADPRHARFMDTDMSADQLERLRQLGYVGTGGGRTNRRDSVRRDPCLK